MLKFSIIATTPRWLGPWDIYVATYLSIIFPNDFLRMVNRFETLQEKTEKSTPNDEYENFVNAHLEAAAKYIPTKIKTKYRVPWETLEVKKNVH